MAGPSVQERALQALRACRHDLGGALLYVDAGAAEAVAAGIGLAAVQDELGAALVCDLSAAAPTDLPNAQLLNGSRAAFRRVTLLLTTLLGEAEAAVLAACEHCPAAAQFTVLCAVSEAAHHEESPAAYPPACYAAVAASWQQRLNERWLPAGLGPCSLIIRHCPLLLCPLTSSAFVLPAGSSAARLPRAGRFAAGYSTSAAAAAADSDDDAPRPAAQAASPAKGTAGRSSGSGTGGASGAPAAGLSLLAHALVDAAATLGYRPEAFSLGPCSRLVCDAMSFVPAASGADLAPAALVLVDRLLDPVSPAQHADLLLQRMYDRFSGSAAGEWGSSGDGSSGRGSSGGNEPGGASAAPPFAPLSGFIPMPSLDAAAGSGAGHSSSSEEGGRGPPSLLPGSLRHADDAQAERWLEFLLTRKGRDSPMFLRKWLREAARKENVPQARSFKPGSISAAELRALADSLRRQSPAAAYRHAALLQLAEAAAAALEGPHADRWEALQREQRQLLFACTETSDAAASQLLDLCALVARSGSGSSRGSGSGSAAGGAGPLLELDDVVLLMLAAYCLLPDFLPWFAAGSGAGGGPFSAQQEQQLEAALVDAVLAGAGYTGSSSRLSSGAAVAARPPAWSLGQLAARAAAARDAAGAAAAAGQGSGTSSSETSIGSSANGSGEASTDVEAKLQSLRLEARDAVQALLAHMRELSAFRRSCLKAQQGQQLGRLAALGEDGAPRPTPLLRQIVECILRDEPLPDLHAGATSLSGLLRSGLGRLGVKAGPKPSDRSTVILFVLGGVSLAELHEIQQAIDERAARASSGGGGSGPQGSCPVPPRIIVGGTALLHPRDLCHQLFAEL